jgi:membrane-associated phospholipid phosphatase
MESPEEVALRFCRPSFITVSVTAALLAVLTVLVIAGFPPLMAFDDAFVLAANTLTADHPPLAIAATIITNIGSPVATDVVTGVAVVASLLRRRARPACYLLLVRALELGVETGLKAVVGRPRPIVPAALTTASESSFPSGHAAGTAALCASLLILLLPRLRRVPATLLTVLGVVFCLAVAASRIALGVHYPSDVVAGLLLGTGCAVAASPLLQGSQAPTTIRRRPDSRVGGAPSARITGRARRAGN